MTSYSNVWDAIETPGAAALLKTKSSLMVRLQESVRAWEVTQATAAKRLGITQPRLNDLLRGRIARFSLDTLFELAWRGGLKVSMEIRKAA